MTKSTPARVARRMERKGKMTIQVDGDAIKRVLNWAHAPSPYQGEIGRVDPVIPAKAGMNNLQVLALLIAVNGFRPRVTGWGFHSGPFGLNQAEALVLMEVSSYFQGLIDGAGLAPESASNMLQPLLEYWATKFEAVAPPVEDGDPAAMVEGGTGAADSVEVPAAAEAAAE